MAHWVVLAQFGHGDEYRSDEAARFEGTLEEARARLYELACTHRPRHGLRQQRRAVYRIGDGDAHYADIEGLVSTFRVIYRLAELVWSSDPVPPPWQ
ncbi:hypothetical protein [Streptomyces sp. NPDC001165]|uniref:hypothetical protein n=1 Tax=Streptomyces sp. NPDC001165 TaxID=3364546 RepID=UPI00368A1409